MTGLEKLQKLIDGYELVEGDLSSKQISAKTAIGENTEGETTHAEVTTNLELPTNILAFLKVAGCSATFNTLDMAVTIKLANALRVPLKAAVKEANEAEVDVDASQVEVVVTQDNWVTYLETRKRVGTGGKKVREALAKASEQFRVQTVANIKATLSITGRDIKSLTVEEMNAINQACQCIVFDV